MRLYGHGSLLPDIARPIAARDSESGLRPRPRTDSQVKRFRQRLLGFSQARSGAFDSGSTDRALKWRRFLVDLCSLGAEYHCISAVLRST